MAIAKMNRVEQRGGAAIIYVSGKLDALSSGALASIIKLFEESYSQGIVVSLEDCSYCYAVGLAVLVTAQKTMGRNLFVVVPIATRFRRIFEITGLSKVLQLVPTVESALNRIGDAELGARVMSNEATKRISLAAAHLPRSA